jgi:hypothetical protein
MKNINLREYSYVDIMVFVLGAFVTGLKEISYTTKVAQEPNHGAGREPRGIQRGKRTYEGSWGITQSELESLNRAARAKGFKDLLDLTDINIVVSYAPKYSNVITTDVIHGASFSEMPKGMKEGDMSSTHTMPFLAIDIEYDTTNPY